MTGDWLVLTVSEPGIGTQKNVDSFRKVTLHYVAEQFPYYLLQCIQYKSVSYIYTYRIHVLYNMLYPLVI